MARLDRFLQVLATHGGDSLEVAPGQPVRMHHRGTLRPVSREALDALQVAALIKELAPPAMVPLLGPQARLSFTYQGPAGPVEVELAPGNGGSAASLRARSGNGVTSGPVQPAGPSEETLAQARAEMERLLRLLAELNGSDLHLRSGEPPIMRRDGDLVRSDSQPKRGSLIAFQIA